MRRCLLPILTLLAAPALAQPPVEQPAAEPVPDVVVEGRRLERQIGEFIDALTPGTARVPIPRFLWKACPATIGLSERQNRLVTQRIRAVAAGARVPLDPEGCRPNLLVIAVAGKNLLLETIAARRPELFETMPAAERDRMMQSPEPAAAWHLRDWRGIYGESLRGDAAEHVRARGPDHLVAPRHRRRAYNENRLMMIPIPGTRMRLPAEPSFASAVVLLELEALDGVTTTQLADYAALRAFAHTDPERVTQLGTPTMLTLFHDRAAGRAPPPRLTSWDLNFLKALYETSNATRGGRQREVMKRRFRRNLERGE